MRRTRVVATIGPSSWDSDNLSALFDAGADVFRLNYSHGEPEHKLSSMTKYVHSKLVKEQLAYLQICLDQNLG